MADTEQPAERTRAELVSPPTALDDAKNSGSPNAHDTDTDTSLEAQNNNSVDPIMSKDSVTVADLPLDASDSDHPSDITGNSTGPIKQIDPVSSTTNDTTDIELPHESEVEQPNIADNDFGGRTTHERAISEDRSTISHTDAAFATGRDEREDERQRRLNRELITAAGDGDVEIVRKRLDEGADLYAKSSEGDNALHIAAHFSHRDVVVELLGRGSDLSIAGAYGWTALQNAVMASGDDNGDVLASILEKSGEEVSHKTHHGRTALIHALKAKKVNRAMAILKNAYGAKTIDIADYYPGWTPLHYACEKGLSEVVRLLLEMKAPLNTRDNAGCTPLHVAARKAHVAIMELLLAHEDIKIAVNTADNQNRTVLFDCVQQDEHVDWVRKLIGCGADLTVEDKDAWTPLIHACVSGGIRMVQLLISNKVDINYRPKDGWTALHTTIGNNLFDVTKMLLDNEADIKLTTEEDGETALHVASRSESLETVRLLLGKGADPTTKSKKGLTALQLAIEQDTEIGRLISIELLRWLKGKDREVGIAQLASSTDWNTFGPILKKIEWTEEFNLEEALTLTCLASDQYPASHKLLCSRLEKKAIKPPGYGPWTALHWAAYLGRSEIVWWLLKSRPPKGMKGTLKDVISLVQDARNSSERTNPPNVNQKNTESTSTDRSNPESQGKNYDVTLDWLRNPPLVQIDTRAESAFLLAQEDRKKCTEIFDATITDFYKKNDRVEFLPRVRPVERVIYEGKGNKNPGSTSGGKVGKLQGPTTNQKDAEPGGPQQIMEDALEQLKKMNLHSGPKDQVEYTKENLCFRWIHLPANNLEWMKDATERVYRDKGTVEHDSGSALPHIIRYSWYEHRGSKPEVRYLRPTCVKEPARGPPKQQQSQNVQQQKPKSTDPEDVKANSGGEDSTMQTMQTEEVSAKTQGASDPKVEPKDPVQLRSVVDKGETYHRLALYMPYLTFGTYDTTSGDSDQTDDRDTTLFHTYRRGLDHKIPGDGKKGKNKEDKKDYEKGEKGAMKNEDIKVEKSEDQEDATNDSDADRKNIEANADRPGDQYVDAILHKTRTLDEFYYDALENTQKRDEEQVVGRYLKENSAYKHRRDHSSSWDILRVDQLWLWVIDHETIITSSTHRTDLEEDPVIEGIHEYLRQVKGRGRKREPTPTSVDEMAKFITSFCIDFMNRPATKCKTGELSARQIFANTINRVANEEKELFDEFEDKIRKKLDELEEKSKSKKEPAEGRDKRKTWNLLQLFSNLRTRASDKSRAEKTKYDQKKEYRSIATATRLLIEVKDIRDELNILRYLLTQQKSVWERLHEITESFKDEHQDNIKASKLSSWTQAEGWESPSEAIQDIEEMDKTAQRIQDAVNSILELEQNDAGISEAEQARELSEETIEQGQTLMAFTVVTIIFLPLSFLTSLFAVNISVFPHKDDNLMYGPEYIFPIIFGVTAVIVIIVVPWAFKAKLRREWKRLRGRRGLGAASSGGPKNKAGRGVGSLFGSMPREARRRNRSPDEEKDLRGKGK